MEYKIITNSEYDTIELAQNFESEKFENMIICLDGELGSGKTVFSKGFAQAMEIKEEITSPTFNLIKEYESGEMALYHMDLYRIGDNIEEIGLEEYYYKKGVVLIEWSDLIQDYLPKERLEIKIRTTDDSENKRIITIKAFGKKYEELCEAVL